MCFFMSFFPAMFWATVGYFLLLSSGKTEGGIRTLGQSLAIVAFVLATAMLLAGAYFSLSGLCSMENWCSMGDRMPGSGA